MTEPLDCLEPAWVTTEEGGDYIPWPEFAHVSAVGYGIGYDDIFSIGFTDGSVYDWHLAQRRSAELGGGWRRWNVGFVPVDLLERMGMSA